MSRIGWKRRQEQMRLKARIASQMRMFHPQMRKTLVANLTELVAAVTQARHVHLAKIAELRRWLPEGVKVYLAADREFHGVDMLASICAQGWIPVVRGKGSTGVTLADGSQQPLNDLTPPVGQMAFHDGVRLTAEQVGLFSLSISCAPPKPGEKLDPWFIISTDPAGWWIIRIYEKRFWIEETFRDFKSYGFHYDQTGVRDPDRLDRLVLIIALACWWVMSVGIWLNRMGLRRSVDRAKRPKLSLFQLGLRY